MEFHLFAKVCMSMLGRFRVIFKTPLKAKKTYLEEFVTEHRNEKCDGEVRYIGDAVAKDGGMEFLGKKSYEAGPACCPESMIDVEAVAVSAQLA